ncbi:MAG: alpha-N-arabinofuranosidase [Candidatus Neomarinimicrobiota bacterium]
MTCGKDRATENRLVIHADQGRNIINRNIYGHFSEHLGRCIYGGIWVGEDSSIPNTRGIRNDVIAALKQIKVPVLRWPGGCFADEYHWKDGIGPHEHRPTMVNTHWGGVTENNHFGTHEFLDLCELVGCEPYISGNLGSGTVEELSDWVEYTTFDGRSPLADLRRRNGRDEPWKVKFWGIGNENWGCGGNMRVEYYVDIYRRYQTYVRAFGANKPFKIASGSYGENYRWTEEMMENVPGWAMQGIGVHKYTVFEDWDKKGSATQFGEYEWFGTLQKTLAMDSILTRHEAIMDRYDPDGNVALLVDEWGAWYDVEPGTNPGFLYQQNTLRDALVAAINLNIFNRHCDRVKMANIAQTVNVLQAIILTEGEQMVLTPTYHVFDMFKVHQDATLLPVELRSREYRYGDEAITALQASASRDADGKIHISICNLDPRRPAELTCEIRGAKPKGVTGQVLTAPAINSHNTFDNPEAVKPTIFDAAVLNGNELVATLPARSVVVLEVF